MDTVATQMLNAITGVPLLTCRETGANRAEMCRYIMKYANLLPYENKIALGSIFKSNQCEDALRVCYEGTAIRLDTLADHVIKQLYDTIVYMRQN